MTLPPTKDYTPRPLDPPANFGTAEVVKAGLEDATASTARPVTAINGQTRGANFPNLTRTPLLHSQEGFDNVVLKGVRAGEGDGVVRRCAEARKIRVAVRAYLTARANELKNAPPPGAHAGAS